MAIAILTDLTAMLPELASVDSGTLSWYLDESRRLVVLDGFNISDDNFDILQRYMCGHLLLINNIIRGNINSESVAGSISASFNIAQVQNYPSVWWERYIALKTQLLPAGAGRIV